MPVNKTNVGDLGPGLLAAEDMRLKQYYYMVMNSSGTTATASCSTAVASA